MRKDRTGTSTQENSNGQVDQGRHHRNEVVRVDSLGFLSVLCRIPLCDTNRLHDWMDKFILTCWERTK